MKISNYIISNYIWIGVLTGAAVLAQGPPDGGRGPGRGFGPGGFRGPGFGPHGGKVVTGAPYSADVNFLRVETLAEGNTIQQSASGKIARDSQGRTYSFDSFTGGPLGQSGPMTRISIFDPVAGYAYELDPTAKTAIKRAIRLPKDGAPDRGAWKGPGPNGDRPARPEAVKTDLGMQVVNGVNAQGARTTRTMPAGAIGNTLPIVSTTETWYSPELQTVISSKHSDPRAGQTTYALTNIQRSDPDASLFQIPAGYSITDAPRGGHRGFGPPPGPPPQEE